MNLEDFQLLDKESFDNSIIERDFIKVYHQHGAQLNQSDQNIEFIFAENSNYHQIVNSYLEFHITVRRNDNADFDDDSAVRLTDNGLVYAFKERRLSTTSCSDSEHNKIVGQVSTILRCLTTKDGGLLSQFDNINEVEIAAEIEDNIKSTSLKNMLFKNQTTAAEKKSKSMVNYQWNIHLEFVRFLKRFLLILVFI